MKQTDPQMKIRLPPDLKNDIEEAAKAANRSMNAEIVDRLQRSVEIDIINNLNKSLIGDDAFSKNIEQTASLISDKIVKYLNDYMDKINEKRD